MSDKIITGKLIYADGKEVEIKCTDDLCDTSIACDLLTCIHQMNNSCQASEETRERCPYYMLKEQIYWDAIFASDTRDEYDW